MTSERLTPQGNIPAEAERLTENFVAAVTETASAPISTDSGGIVNRLRSWRDKGIATLAAAGLVVALGACNRNELNSVNTEHAEPVAEQIANPPIVPEAKIKTPETPTTTTTTAVKIENTKPELRPGEIAKVSAALGWESLANAPLAILDRYTTSQAEVVILSHEGAKPSATLIQEFKAALAIADRISSQNPQFRGYDWKLGPDIARNVSFNLLPSKPSADTPAQRYVVFTAAGAAAKLQPAKTAVPGPITAKSADKSFGITLLPDMPGQTPEGHNTNEFNAFLEAFSLASDAVMVPEFASELEKMDLSNVANPTYPKPSIEEKKQLLNATGRRMVAYSWGLARHNAKTGASYFAYARQQTIPVRTDTNTVEATCYNLPEGAYSALSYKFDKP